MALSEVGNILMLSSYPVIEFLPAELKARFLQIRSLDDHVQSRLALSAVFVLMSPFLVTCRSVGQPQRQNEDLFHLVSEEQQTRAPGTAVPKPLSGNGHVMWLCMVNVKYSLIFRNMRRL